MNSNTVTNGIARAGLRQRFINHKILSAIRNLSLVAKTVVQGFISGLHRSPYHGFSMEFAEYRAYAPGDDIRGIDWKVYARSDRFFVKKYEGDTNTQLYLLLDCSRSMGFASHGVSKLDYARFLAASLAYLARRQKDAVGLMTFDSQVRGFTKARTRRGQYQALLHQLDEAEAGEKTDIAGAVQQLANLTQKRSLLVLISDFYEDPQAIGRVLRFFHLRGNDMLLFHLLDPAELEPPFASVSTLEDMESAEHQVYVPEGLEAYRERLQAHVGELRRTASEMAIDYQVLNTEEPLDLALYRYLTARARNY